MPIGTVEPYNIVIQAGTVYASLLDVWEVESDMSVYTVWRLFSHENLAWWKKHSKNA